MCPSHLSRSRNTGMTAQDEKWLEGLKPRIPGVLKSLGYPDGPDELVQKGVEEVRGVFTADEEWTRKCMRNGRVSKRAIENVAILRIWCGIIGKDIRKIFAFEARDDADVSRRLETREKELEFRAEAYAYAAPRFEQIKPALLAGGDINSVELPFSLVRPEQRQKASEHVALPLSLIEAIDRVRDTLEFQAGDPNATAKVIEGYIELGATQIAHGLLDDALADYPEHPGLWFQKARLLLALSENQYTLAGSYSRWSEESEPLSAAENHWQDLAFETQGQADSLRDSVFDVCVRAFGYLPDNKAYEASASKWSRDYGELRKLREKILLYIVHDAGRKCDPHRGRLDKLHDKVLARLGSLTKWEPGSGSIIDEERTASLAAEPIFSAETDKLVVSAYKELFGEHPWVITEYASVRLSALNFLRIYLPTDEYRAEVEKFVQVIRQVHCSDITRFLAPYDGLQASFAPLFRIVLHEHLDAVLTKREQRELVRETYKRWADWVRQFGEDTVKSIYDDEIRHHFGSQDYEAAYRTACDAEEAGNYRRDVGHGALMLKATATWLLENTSGDRIESNLLEKARSHLADRAMCDLAREHYEQVYDDDEYPTPELFYVEL